LLFSLIGNVMIAYVYGYGSDYSFSI